MSNLTDKQEQPAQAASDEPAAVIPAENTDFSNQSEKMDRSSALEILGLNETANAYAVDNRFWQLTKRYRAEKNDEKLKLVTAAYEVASGRAAERQAEQIVDNQGKKFLGKSIRQWKVSLYYSWWKILALILCVFLGGSLVYQMITGGNYDIKVVSIGHFAVDNTFFTDYSVDKLGYKKPYITSADLVIDGSEAENNATIYGAAAAASFLGIEPDVIIFDAKTMPYYLTTVTDLDSFYAYLQENLPQVFLDQITPVTGTMKQYKELTAEEGDQVLFSPDDEVEHVYGLQISDPGLIHALGYTNEWMSQKDSLVFSIGATSKDITKAEAFIESILRDQNIIAQEYQAADSSDTESTSAAS
ncbi:MAG: hypothetical protein WCG21_12690 [Eubacteriales bacterium]